MTRRLRLWAGLFYSAGLFITPSVQGLSAMQSANPCGMVACHCPEMCKRLRAMHKPSPCHAQTRSACALQGGAPAHMTRVEISEWITPFDLESSGRLFLPSLHALHHPLARVAVRPGFARPIDHPPSA